MTKVLCHYLSYFALIRLFLFVCLEFFVTLENVSLIWRRHHYRWRAANFDLCSVWPLSSKGSLACDTFCDTGHSFIMVILEDPWHSHLLPSVWKWSCHYMFSDLGLLRLGFEHQKFRLRGDLNMYLKKKKKKKNGREKNSLRFGFTRSFSVWKNIFTAMS